MNAKPITTPPGPYDRHPWKEWFGMDKFTLIRGVDYGCQTHGMVQGIRNTSRKPKFKRLLKGAVISISSRDDRIDVVITRPEKK